LKAAPPPKRGRFAPPPRTRRPPPAKRAPILPPPRRVEEENDRSILDLVDNLLNQGVVINGEIILGVAGVDLIYLRLSALLAAADRVLPRPAK
jgi:hypothetical protein